MPVRLRMQRYGAKKRPYYRMVATDKRSPRDGRFIEMLGTYDPLQEPAAVRMNSERVEYWLSVGAQPTDTVRSLIRQMRRGDVVDLSQVGADEAARKQTAEQKRQAQEALRAKITEDAKAAEAEAKAKAKAEAEAKKAEAEAKKKAEAEAKEAEEKAEAGGDDAEEAEEAKADEAEEADEAKEAKADEAEEADKAEAEESDDAEDASDEEE